MIMVRNKVQLSNKHIHCCNKRWDDSDRFWFLGFKKSINNAFLFSYFRFRQTLSLNLQRNELFFPIHSAKRAFLSNQKMKERIVAAGRLLPQ